MLDSGTSHPQKYTIVCPPTYSETISGIATGGTSTKLNNTFSSHRVLSKPKSFLPPDLGKSAHMLGQRAKTVVFYKTCVEERVPYKLNKPPTEAHPAVSFLTHIRKHRVPISAKNGMTGEELARSLCYGTHASATK